MSQVCPHPCNAVSFLTSWRHFDSVILTVVLFLVSFNTDSRAVSFWFQGGVIFGVILTVVPEWCFCYSSSVLHIAVSVCVWSPAVWSPVWRLSIILPV